MPLYNWHSISLGLIFKTKQKDLIASSYLSSWNWHIPLLYIAVEFVLFIFNTFSKNVIASV